MKRISLIILSLIILSITAFAVPGDIAGVYYSTDINTILNGEEIMSINIGGQTLISAEDMEYYAFDVRWDDGTRELFITSSDHEEDGVPPTIKKSNYPSGMVCGNYYETDIITYLNYEKITAYNIGGHTFIHAEEMANFGFLVEWVEEDRNLLITSPEFAGYKYSFAIANGKPQTLEGSGGFSLKYTKDGVTGTGDAEYFDSTISNNGREYTVYLGFYQNDGLFYSTKLKNLLSSLSSGGTAYPIYKPEEKFDLVNEHVTVEINGHRASEMAVAAYQGNGHRTFYLEIYDLPNFTESEIEEIYIAIGNQIETEQFEIIANDEYTVLQNEYKKAQKSVLKNPLDWVQTGYTTENFFVFNVRESPSLGMVTDRLYLLSRKTGEISSDILEQVRKHDGFNYDRMNVYAISVKDVKNNLFFSCKINEGIVKTGDFYVEMDSGTVHLIAETIWE